MNCHIGAAFFGGRILGSISAFLLDQPFSKVEHISSQNILTKYDYQIGTAGLGLLLWRTHIVFLFGIPFGSTFEKGSTYIVTYYVYQIQLTYLYYLFRGCLL
jgi:hypothetical protein